MIQSTDKASEARRTRTQDDVAGDVYPAGGGGGGGDDDDDDDDGPTERGGMGRRKGMPTPIARAKPR